MARERVRVCHIIITGDVWHNFGLSGKHIGLYIPPPVIGDHAGKLKNYITATATVRFPIERTLPVGLIKND